MIELKHEVSLRQQLELTPQLIQALRLLQLTRLELEQELKTELEANPFLEEEQAEHETAEGDVNVTVGAGTPAGGEHRSLSRREEDPIENMTHRDMGLHDYLLWQLSLSANTDLEVQIGEAIIGNINDEGYLTTSVEDIASFTGADTNGVENVLKKVQEFDPSGVGARDLKECLLIQIRYFGIDEPVISSIISDHLADLQRKDYPTIARALSVTVDLVITAANTISHLNPKPGYTYSSVEDDYIIPDVMVMKRDDRLIVDLIEDGIPRLAASDYYARKLLTECSNDDDAKRFIREKMQGAKWLIKAVEQRKNTIRKVVEAIVARQRDFFEYGEQYIVPMVLKDIADDIGIHETTVGRVTNGKYVQTPWGIYELKYFFSPSLRTDSGDLLSTKIVKQRIKDLIEKEDACSPLSDTDIVRVLKTDGVNIARRTVAKYREIMNIAPIHLRKVKAS